VAAFVSLQNASSLTILVLGKCGVGKSSTVNSIVGERVAAASAFQVFYLLSSYSTHGSRFMSMSANILKARCVELIFKQG
jgi:putative ribosome biogenesis GTPase RsgA